MMFEFDRRRFLALLSAVSAADALLSPARSQGRIHTVGFLMGLGNDAEAQSRIKAFEQGLAKEGLTPGRDIRIHYRFASSDPARIKSLAKELVGLRPDVIVGHSSPVTAQLVQATHTIPIVFVVVADPVGSGFVKSIARPGTNATGFTNLAATITGKLLAMLRQIAPDLSRVALLFSPDASINAGQLFLHPLQAAAQPLGVEVITAAVTRPAEIESYVQELARKPNSGLIVMPDNFTTVNRQFIISLAARLRIPAVYPYRFFAESGGLMSYGVDIPDLFRRSSEYVCRILQGERPEDLPVQAPTKFELVINTKTANALGLTVPKILLAGADALID